MEPTEVQKQIIEHEGNAVVLAAPGSGKTFVLANKIKNVICQDDFLPYQGVIAVSYTRKASHNLKSRTLGDGVFGKNSFFGTIDNFCLTQIILPFGAYLGGHPKKELSIINLKDLSNEQQDLFNWINTAHPDYPDIKLSKFKDLFMLYQSGYLLIESLELLGLHLINNCKACRKYIKARFRCVFIDEYQDADTYIHDIFMSLVDLGLTGVAVGDVNQSIFGFAHKDSKFLTSLETVESFTTFKLDKNFRCSLPIINYSNRLLDSNSTIFETKEDTGVVFAKVEGNESNIAAFIDKYLKDICKCLNIANLCNVAILAKNERTLRQIDSHLKTAHRIVESTPLDMDLNPRSHLYSQLLRFFFNKKATFLEIIDEYIDYENLSKSVRNKLNILKNSIRSLEAKDINKLPTYCELIANILLPNIPERESLDKLKGVINQLRWISSYYPMLEDEVQLMTLHKSKGLEFDLVFHLNMCEWELPNKRVIDNNFDNIEYLAWEQDLNLHYVGITRARKACILVRSTLRTNSNQELKNAKDSEFLTLNNVQHLRQNVIIKQDP